ncbi:MAG: hypothetical protein KJ592_05125 [Nanoarchaeota archaeon]|nr:hypothetical protein [Nanoarchaeota archaeon]
MKNPISIISPIITLIIAIITIYTQLESPESGLIAYIAILLLIILVYVLSLPINYFKQKITLIELNKNAIIKTNKDLNKLKESIDIEKRLIKLELKNETKK